MAKSLYEGKFYSTDLTVTAATTYTTASGVVNTANMSRVSIVATAKGANASSSGAVTFATSARVNNVWSTDIFLSFTVTVADTAVKSSAPEIIDVDGISAIKVVSVTNGDATYDAEAVNLLYGNVQS